MSPRPMPAPTATLTMIGFGSAHAGAVGVDLVCDPIDGHARVVVVLPNSPLSFRLDLSRAQLGALMDELVELADVAEQQAEQQAQPAPDAPLITVPVYEC